MIDWLIKVYSRFKLLEKILYLTVANLDRFLQVGIVGTLYCHCFGGLWSTRCLSLPLHLLVQPVSQDAPACTCDSYVGGFKV